MSVAQYTTGSVTTEIVLRAADDKYGLGSPPAKQYWPLPAPPRRVVSCRKAFDTTLSDW